MKLFKLIIILLLFLTLDIIGTNVYQKIDLIIKSKDNFRELNPVYHHELKKNYAGKGHKNEKIFTDKNGLIILEKDKDKKINLENKDNYIFIGDSFTQGAGIDYKNTFAGIITKELKKKNQNVINMSTISYSPSIEYLKIKYFVENNSLKFSKLFLFLDLSDPYDELYRCKLKNQKIVNREIKKNPFKKNLNQQILFQSKNFIINNTTITFSFLKILKDLLIKKDKNEEAFFEKYGFIINHQANIWTYDEEYYASEGYKGIDLCKKYLLEINNLVKEMKAELTIIVYPWPGQIYRNDYNIKQASIWKEWTLENSVNFLDLSSIFYENQIVKNKKNRLKIIDEFYLQKDMHFNEKGHKLVSKKLLDFIK